MWPCDALWCPVWPCGALWCPAVPCVALRCPAVPRCCLCVSWASNHSSSLLAGGGAASICHQRQSALGQRTAARVELGLPNKGCRSDFADPVLPGSRLGRLELLIKILGSPEGFSGNFVQLRENKFQVCF